MGSKNLNYLDLNTCTTDDVAVLRSELQNVQKIMVEDIGEKKEKKLDDLRSENEGLKIEVAKLNQDSQSKNTQWNQQVSQLEGNLLHIHIVIS